MLHNFNDETLLSLCVGQVSSESSENIGFLLNNKRHENFQNVKISDYYGIRKAKNYNDVGTEKTYSLFAMFSKMMFNFYFYKIKNSGYFNSCGSHQRDALITRMKSEFLLHHPFDSASDFLLYFLKNRDYNRAALFTYTTAFESREILKRLDLGGKTVEFIDHTAINQKGVLFKREILR